MPYKNLWLFFKVWHKTQNPNLLLKRSCFLSHLVLGIYVYTENISRRHVDTKYIQQKRISRALSFAIYVIVQLFVHTREWDRSTQVGVEPVFMRTSQSIY